MLFRADTPVPPLQHLYYFGHPQGMALRCCSLLGGHAGTAPTVLFSLGRTHRYRPYGVVLFRAPTRDAPTALYSFGRTRRYRPYGVVLFWADTLVPPLLYLYSVLCSLYSFGRTRRYRPYCICTLSCASFLQNPYRIS